MDILKKHYEKLILLLLLLIFIGLMFHVLSIVQQTSEIQIIISRFRRGSRITRRMIRMRPRSMCREFSRRRA